MNELLKIKCIIEAQISAIKELQQKDAIKESDNKYLVSIKKDKQIEYKAKVEAWEATLKILNKEIEWNERLLEELKIFEPNEAVTYGLI